MWKREASACAGARRQSVGGRMRRRSMQRGVRVASRRSCAETVIERDLEPLHEITAALRGAIDGWHEPGLRHWTVRRVIDRVHLLTSQPEQPTNLAIVPKLRKRRTHLLRDRVVTEPGHVVPVGFERGKGLGRDRDARAQQRIQVRAGAAVRMVSNAATVEKVNFRSAHGEFL